MKRWYPYKQYVLVLFLCLIVTTSSHAFSILAHEAIIDAAWTNDLRPILAKHYPDATTSQLDSARAYAYGGSLVADIGYMPFANQYFSNLLHYVRSGDFVNTLVEEACTLNEYAFALGAISHYIADKYGHALATNLSVSLFYPKLKKKFGEVVTYDDDHTSHSAMEFAFDVIQTVKGNYASIAYHNFSGFNIEVPLLKRVFRKIYGQSLQEVFPNIESTISNFRWAVSNLLPELARIAWKADKEGMKQSRNLTVRAGFCDKMPGQAFDKKVGKVRSRADLPARSVAFLIQSMPKIGPLKKLKFRYPGPTCEQLFLQSMDSIAVNYAAALRQADNCQLALMNINFDTGRPSAVSEYALADKTYNDWTERLYSDKSVPINLDIQESILSFYQKNKLREPTAELKILAAQSH